jgi:hypothetical protein
MAKASGWGSLAEAGQEQFGAISRFGRRKWPKKEQNGLLLHKLLNLSVLSGILTS